MTRHDVFLSRPRLVAPLHKAPQSDLLAFLAESHAEGEPNSRALSLLQRYGVKENQIASRSFECGDVFLAKELREIYRMGPGAENGASIFTRGEFFSKRAREIFEKFYPELSKAPDHLVHVTCTGYISPSAAQRIVSERGWDTEITHAYHMGCYASLPAIRIAMGQSLAFNKRVDIAHTEMCSLHMNPADHLPEQLVVQSLFADGHALYTVSQNRSPNNFRILAVHERLLADSAQDMEWMPAAWGMKMTLSRNVPQKIKGAIRAFLLELLPKAGISLDSALKNAIFAVHPGGPKIIDSVKESLELSEEQVNASRKILQERGNMSSSTLPHVWEEISQNPPEKGCPVISLAFGPGLTIFGGVFLWEP